MRNSKILPYLALLVISGLISCSSSGGDQATNKKSADEKPSPENLMSEEQAVGDAEKFVKNLSLQGFDFDIEAEDMGEYSKVTINTSGLEKDDPMIMEMEGTVSDAQIEDLDSDGYPEVILISHSGENHYGHVYGVTVLSGSSLGMVALPDMASDSELAQGYNGHDEFTLIETYLGRRFPLYENGTETGTVRQITYKLQNGENGKVFVQHNVSEF